MLLRRGLAVGGRQPSSCRLHDAGLPAPVTQGAPGCSTSSQHPCSSRHARKSLRRPLRPCHAASPEEPAAQSSPSEAESGPAEAAAAVVAEQPAPWSPEDLAAMAAKYEELQELQQGEEWRSMFADDLEDLYSYSDREEAQWADVLNRLKALPKDQWQRSSLPLQAQTFTPALANSFVGLGTWRLRHALDPILAFLAMRMEGTWREAFEDDLNLYPASRWKEQFAICDSMDPKRELEGWSYADIPHPEEGAEGYPRLLIENRCYCSRVFRKLHLEVAWRQDGLQVLHMVMYPRYTCDLPILAMDMVLARGRVSLAVIDACPVRKNKQLPPHYLKTMFELQQQFLSDADNQRRLPEWGQAIFSPGCVCIRPDTPEELAGFLRYTVALTRAHCALATLVQPLEPAEPRNKQRLAELLEGHKAFCDNQLENKKTSRVLEVAFGPEWTDAYMRKFMFDFDPEDEPAWEDASLTQLWRYFEDNPELGNRAEDLYEQEAEAELERAEEVLSSLNAGEPVRLDRVEEALQMLYVYDEEFRRNCLVLLPGLANVRASEVGVFLAQHTARLGLPTPAPRWTSTPSKPSVPSEPSTAGAAQ